MEVNKNIIKFEMNKSILNFYKFCQSGAILIIPCIYIFFLVLVEKKKYEFTNHFVLTWGDFFGLVLVGLYFFGIKSVGWDKLAFELTYDQENKEFDGLILGNKEVIKFMPKDIKEFVKRPRGGGIRFYLNDGKSITMDTSLTIIDIELERLLRSLGVSIRIKRFL